MQRVEIVAVLGSLGLLGMVIELVRRRKLGVGYSLLWLMTGIILLVLSLFRQLLDVLASLVGIFYPPAALFVAGFGFLLLILLQFSIVVSRLSDQNNSLTQRLAITEWRLRQLEERHAGRTDTGSDSGGDQTNS